MKQLVFFLEEPSAREMLKGILPRVLPEEISQKTIIPYYVVFEGKQDLEKQLPRKLRAWQQTESLFVVIRDQDSGDCLAIKRALAQKCCDAGKPSALIRIACHELESFYLGDLSAVAKSIGPERIEKLQNKAKFREPDKLANPAQELKNIAPGYQKIAGSRAISPCLIIENNRSNSFNALVNGIRQLVCEPA